MSCVTQGPSLLFDEEIPQKLVFLDRPTFLLGGPDSKSCRTLVNGFICSGVTIVLSVAIDLSALGCTSAAAGLSAVAGLSAADGLSLAACTSASAGINKK